MQRCARLGGVWDDSVAAEMLGAGGRCITPEAAHTKTQQHREAFEVISMPLSSDGNLSGVLVVQRNGCTLSRTLFAV